MSPKGIDFLVKEEGVVLHPYLDSVKVPTIGIGSTQYEDGRKVTMKDPAITLERAKQLFTNTLKKYEATVANTIKREVNQNQFDAMVSLCYNIGQDGFSGSTVARLVNANPCDVAIKNAFEMWKKPIELLARRKREWALYFS